MHMIITIQQESAR